METKDINMLSDRICEIVIDEVEALYPLFMKRVNDIDIDYFEDIVRDSEELPKELNFELRDTVLNDIKAYATQLLEESNIRSRVEAVAKDADETTKKEVFDKARALIRSYIYTSCVLNGSSDFTEDELKCMYEDAKNVTCGNSLCRITRKMS